MELPFLTDEEIRQIVSPLIQPRAICRWFSDNGFVVKVRPNGLPLVSRAAFNQVTSNMNSHADINKSDSINTAGYISRFSKKKLEKNNS